MTGLVLADRRLTGSIVIEIDLNTFALAQRWPEAVDTAGCSWPAVRELLSSRIGVLPARRLVRSLELVGLLRDQQSSLPGSSGASSLYAALDAICCSLSEHPGVAFEVERPITPAGAGQPSGSGVDGEAGCVGDHSRVLIASSPRSGSTLLQQLLLAAGQQQVVTAHDVGDIDLGQVANRALLQLHPLPTPAVLGVVAELGAEVVTVGRHPLDVLLSILHFCRHEPQVGYWLDGEGFDDLPGLATAAPASATFLAWATGPGAGRLLSVSAEWWRQPDVWRVSYEALVGDPENVVASLVEDLRLGQQLPSGEATTLRQQLLSGLPNHHRWRGRPGGWRSLLPAEVARPVYEAHRDVFDTLGYDIGGELVERRSADENWARLSLDPARPHHPASA